MKEDPNYDRDLVEHPEWFEVNPLREYTGSYKGIPIYEVINPPILITRKPIPFVLPIKGAGG